MSLEVSATFFQNCCLHCVTRRNVRRPRQYDIRYITTFGRSEVMVGLSRIQTDCKQQTEPFVSAIPCSECVDMVQMTLIPVPMQVRQTTFLKTHVLQKDPMYSYVLWLYSTRKQDLVGFMARSDFVLLSRSLCGQFWAWLLLLLQRPSTTLHHHSLGRSSILISSNMERPTSLWYCSSSAIALSCCKTRFPTCPSLQHFLKIESTICRRLLQSDIWLAQTFKKVP